MLTKFWQWSQTITNKFLAAFIDFLSIKITLCTWWTRFKMFKRNNQDSRPMCSLSYGKQNCCRALAVKSIKNNMVGSWQASSPGCKHWTLSFWTPSL